MHLEVQTCSLQASKVGVSGLATCRWLALSAVYQPQPSHKSTDLATYCVLAPALRWHLAIPSAKVNHLNLDFLGHPVPPSRRNTRPSFPLNPLHSVTQLPIMAGLSPQMYVPTCCPH